MKNKDIKTTERYNTAIEVANVSKTYGKLEAVKI